MSIYNNTLQLFTDLVEYNEKNIEFMGSMQIPITNIYYITFLDHNDKQINDFFEHLKSFENKNPFENIKVNLNIDQEQVCSINIIKSTLQYINNQITETLNNAKESNSKISVILDINLLFKIIESFEEKEIEVHLYDFILHILKNKVDKLLILDYNNILKADSDKLSSVYEELKLFLLKEKYVPKSNINENLVTIYKTHKSLYWKIFNLNQRISYLDPCDEEEKLADEISLVEIDDEEAILSTIDISKICFSNLFEMHTFVLNPLHKLNKISLM